MKRNGIMSLLLALMLLCSLTVSGIYANWVYPADAEPVTENLENRVANFHYGPFYISNVVVDSGSFTAATASKSGEVDMTVDVTLNSNTSSSVTYAVTFHNNTDVSYYYNKTETVAWNNDKIAYSVTGVQQKEEVLAHSYKTLYVTVSYDGSNTSKASVAGQLHFNFVVDKDSIGTVVAQTAVDRFQEILNNEAFADSYSTLKTAMDNRTGAILSSSAVTYIGNVAGSGDGDSKVINTLFGDQFMSMDLDGDGNPEPITMMIKRENIDGNDNTGDSYSYKSFGFTRTEYGADMTLYITAVDLEKTSARQYVTVYAAAFTKQPGSDEWTLIVPLTKGEARTNGYNGSSSGHDSFNTDTWRSDDGKTIEDLA